MPRLTRKLLPAAVLPAVLMASAALLHGLDLSIPHLPRGLFRERVLKGVVLHDQLLSFDETAGYVRMYLAGHEDMMREGLLRDARWVLDLKREGELVEVSFPGGEGGEAAARYRVNATGEGGGSYIDGAGMFHFVKLGDGKPSVDLAVGFDPLRGPLNGLHPRPSWVALYDRENGTSAAVFRNKRARFKKAEPKKGYGVEGAANGGGGVRVALDGLFWVRFAKVIELRGSRVQLVSRYPLLSPRGSIFLFGLLIVAALAILVSVSTGVFGVPAHGVTRRGAWGMGPKKTDRDVVEEIDIAVLETGSRRAAPGEAGSAGLAEGESPAEGPSGTTARIEGDLRGTERKVREGEKPFDTLEKDGIIIKKRA